MDNMISGINNNLCLWCAAIIHKQGGYYWRPQNITTNCLLFLILCLQEDDAMPKLLRIQQAFSFVEASEKKDYLWNQVAMNTIATYSTSHGLNK